jgi:hypothetical protein
VVDHRDGSENGVGFDVEMQTLVGSQQVPYIYEDYVSCETIAEGMMKIYEMNDVDRRKLKKKVRKYATTEFSYQKTIDDWHESLTSLEAEWKENYKRWECMSL